MNFLTRIILVTISAFYSLTASAIPITIEFSGVMSAPSSFGGVMSSLISENNTIEGEFRYDSDALFTPAISFGYNPGEDGVSIAHYRHTAPEFGFDVTIGGQYSFGSDPSNTDMYVQVADNRTLAYSTPIDRFGFWSRGSNTTISSTSIAPNFQMFFYDYDASVFSGVTLPDLDTNWSEFTSVRGEISLPSSDPDSFFSTFEVTSFNVRATELDLPSVDVSEPSGLLLLLSGFFTLILRKKIKRFAI